MSVVIEINQSGNIATMSESEIWAQQDFVDNAVRQLIEELTGTCREWV
jgi:hypothetical protein